MTPTQRRELERLIDERETAAVDMAIARMRGRWPDNAESEQFKIAYRALMHYLDEVTDYSTAGAVSGS